MVTAARPLPCGRTAARPGVPSTPGSLRLRDRAKEEAAARAATERDRYVRRDDAPVVLDGRAVMEVLGIPSSPLVGTAIRHLQEVHLERGSLTADEAATELRRWARRR